MSLIAFFNHVDAYFSLLTMCVYSLVMWVGHNNSSTGYYIWGSSSFPHIIACAPPSLVNLWQNNNFFVLGLHCYRWSSFHNHRSLLAYGFFLIFCQLFFVFTLGCVYSCSHLPCTFDGWVPVLDFFIHGFSSFLKTTLLKSHPKKNLEKGCIHMVLHTILNCYYTYGA
jgi:hypothetical protein